MPLDTACGNKRASLAQRRDDLYETPAVAVESLLRVEQLPRRIWEPACGPGSIVRALRAAGHKVMATDLVDYASPDQDEAWVDFLMTHRLLAPCVVTNPPFKLADQFVEHALWLGADQIFMLLRLAFLESDRRSGVLDSGRLARVHVYRRRLPMMHRAGWEGRRASSAMAFAWLVWERDHRGPALLDRISWDRR
jgi:hypothetical protein